MVAGLNLKVKFTRLVYSDDDVGGSYPTGTVLYDNIDGRISPLSFNGMNPQVIMAMQGLETKRPLSGMFWPGTLTIREEDECEVISPPNHLYFGQKFRITTVEYDGNHPDQKRNHLLVTLVRSDIAHKNEIQ
jgi:hypothetical protein